MTSYVGSSFKRMVQENVIHLTVVERAEALEAVSTEQKQLLTTMHQRAQLDFFGIILRTGAMQNIDFCHVSSPKLTSTCLRWAQLCSLEHHPTSAENDQRSNHQDHHACFRPAFPRPRPSVSSVSQAAAVSLPYWLPLFHETLLTAVAANTLLAPTSKAYHLHQSASPVENSTKAPHMHTPLYLGEVRIIIREVMELGDDGVVAQGGELVVRKRAAPAADSQAEQGCPS